MATPASTHTPSLLTISIVLALMLAGSSLVLFVLPGYYIYLIGDAVISPYLGHVHGDNLLPIAMQVQLLWAPALPLSTWFAQQFFRRAPSRARLLQAFGLALLLMYAWATTLAWVFHTLLAEAAP